MRAALRISLTALGLVLCTGPLLALSAPAVSAAADSEQLNELAASVPMGGTLTVTGLDLGADTAVTLELERFRVFTDDAVVVVHGPDGDTRMSPPADLRFRGQVADRPSSAAFLTVLEDGTRRGLVVEPGRFWMLGEGDAGLAGREADADALSRDGERNFECSSGQLNNPRAMLEAALEIPKGTAPREHRGVSHTAQIAIETDNEFLNRFSGDTTAATSYAGDLIAYGSGVYAAEVETDLLVNHVSLWTATDPWAQFGTLCGLFEFGRYWNDNNSGISRTLVHYFSGEEQRWRRGLGRSAVQRRIRLQPPGRLPGAGAADRQLRRRLWLQR